MTLPNSPRITSAVLLARITLPLLASAINSCIIIGRASFNRSRWSAVISSIFHPSVGLSINDIEIFAKEQY